MIKQKFIIVGMHCTSCAINIDGELEDTAGVTSSRTSYAKQQTDVEFDPSVVSAQTITEIISSIGYEVQAAQ